MIYTYINSISSVNFIQYLLYYVKPHLIVNIKTDGGKKIEDPYGNIHTIPTRADFKINSHRERGIEITEIKEGELVRKATTPKIDKLYEN